MTRSSHSSASSPRAASTRYRGWVTRARRSALEQALADYDGRHSDVLKELLEELQPRAPVLRQAVRLAVHPDERIRQGATYLLWAWVGGGARVTRALVTEIAELLPRVKGKWVCLHLVRCVPKLSVPAELVAVFATFLERCRGAQLPFLRAWAIDALHELSLQHEVLHDVARRAREEGQDDAAPSVRKRVQKILGGG